MHFCQKYIYICFHNQVVNLKPSSHWQNEDDVFCYKILKQNRYYNNPKKCHKNEPLIHVSNQARWLMSHKIWNLFKQLGLNMAIPPWLMVGMIWSNEKSSTNPCLFLKLDIIFLWAIDALTKLFCTPIYHHNCHIK